MGVESSNVGNIGGRFERWANESPDKIACREVHGTTTYGALNEASNRLRHHLQSVRGDTTEPIVLLFGHGVAAVAAYIGVLKAARICVALDPSWPVARLAAMLDDSGASIVAADRRNEALARSLAGGSAEVVILEDLEPAPALVGPQPVLDPDQPAYLIYTSGSTGKPKAIIHSHRTALHNLDNYTRLLRLRSGDCLSWLHSISFSSSLVDIFCALLNGACLLPWDSRSLGLQGFQAWANQHGLTVFSWAPTPFRQLVDGMRGTRGLLTPRLCILGSEMATRRDWELFRRYFPDDCILVNRLGATEVNNYRMAFLDKSTRPSGAVLPGGFAVPDKEVTIIDDSGRLAGIDEPGQIVVRSRYCSPGYWQRPDLTAEAFRPDPNDPEVTLFHTGDFGILRADGCLEFLGRADQQVKIRGHRVEVGEIEDTLASHNAVSQAAVALGQSPTGVPQLVAYVVPRDPAPNERQLREFVAKRLPDFMVPAAFVLLDCLPTTESGKVNRRALPAPPDTRTSPVDGYDAPGSALERELADIWTSVLGIDDLGTNENFFDLGGDSLRAMAISARIRARLGLDTSVKLLIKNPTIKRLAKRLSQDLERQPSSASCAIPRLDEAARRDAPLSFAQQGIWFVHQLDPRRSAYNVPFTWRLLGPLNAEHLRWSLEQIVHRHEPLRTVFKLEGGLPASRVLPLNHFQLPLLDSRALESPAPGDVESRIAEEVERPFDLERDVLLRALLLRSSPQDHALVLTVHHAAFDGWSLGVLWRELQALYAAASSGAKPFLPALPVSYSDYAAWQREQATGNHLEPSIRYWRERLSNLAPSQTVADRPRPGSPSFRSDSRTFRLGVSLSDRVRRLARQETSTRHLVLLAGFQVLLGRYSGLEDVAVGVPFAGRTVLELEGAIGCFMNILVMRTDLSDNPTFRELIARVSNTSASDQDHADLPFEKLVEALHPDREFGKNPLFQVVFQYQELPRDWDLAALEVIRIPCSPPGLPVDVEVRLWEERDAMEGSIHFSTDLFEVATIERMIDHYLTLLDHATSSPETTIGNLPILSAHEQKLLTVDWNDTAADYPRECTLNELFADRVRLAPQAVAVECGDQRLTYSELDEKASRLAARLVGMGVGPGVKVGIFLDRSTDMLAAVLGIFKAGGAYVPLDTTIPDDRLEFMVRDASVAIIVSTGLLDERLARCEARLVDPAGDSAGPILQARAPYSRAPRAEDLAYVIYTSGSTGRPKGVLVTHRNVVNLLNAIGPVVGCEPDDTLLAVSSLSFDISALELLLPLSTGGRVVIAESAVVRDGTKLRALLERSGATIMQATPSTWKLLLASGWHGTRGLKVLCGGESLSRDLAGQLLERAAAVWNVYGPTETTIWSSLHRVTSAEQAHLIGRPLANTRMYVQDAAGRAVPVGIPGELLIAGDGVAQGYLARPELTAERFVDDPVYPGEPAYRTGDHVRWHADGSLEFLGRADNQVKLRGFRIELGEIESLLEEHPAVDQSVVVLRTDESGDGRIAAYWTLRTDAETPSPRLLADHLRSHLPAYMVPSTFIRLAALPMTSSGKVDRRALPPLEIMNGRDARHCESPRSSLESKLVEIWSRLLERADIGIHDDFFHLGGHSLLAIRLLWMVEHELNRQISIATLFQHPTVAELAECLEIATVAQTQPVVEQCRDGSGGPAIVILPSLLGECFEARLLSKLLPPHLPVYGMMLAGNQPYWPGCETLADIAAGFMKALLDAVPSGPWILVGYSFGGRLAFELARQLQAAGRSVSLIVIIDTGIPPTHRSLRVRLTRDLPSILANIPRKLAFELGHSPRALARRLSLKLRVLSSPLRLSGRSNGAVSPSLGEQFFGVTTLPELYKQRLELSVRAFREYRPGVYAGRLAVVRCRLRPLFHIADPDMGWKQWVDGTVEVRAISGPHSNLFSPTRIQDLARTIVDLLESPDRR